MSYKKKLISFHKLDYNEFFEILERNQNKIPIKLSDVAVQHYLRKIFEDNLEILSPLINKIKLIDELIDQILYKLYDLTDNEIAIIEATIK